MTMLGNSIRQELEPMLVNIAKVAQIISQNIGLIIDAIKVLAISLGVIQVKLLLIKAIGFASTLASMASGFMAIIPVVYGASGAMGVLAFSLGAVKTALISTGIGAIPVIIGIAIVWIGKFIDAWGGVSAMLLKIKDVAIVVFESIAGFFARMIEGIVNTYRKVKSFFTGEKFEEYKINVGVNEEAHHARLREIEAEKAKHSGSNKSPSFQLEGGVDLNSLSPNAQNQLTSSVKLANEDIKYLGDLAERKYVMQVNLNTMPNVSINQNVSGNGASNLGDIERGLISILDNYNGVSNIV